jgi:phosphoglycerol transferase MdoB-like AlkP superfamily enzyme
LLAFYGKKYPLSGFFDYARQLKTIPLLTPILYVILIAAIAMGIALWFSAFDFLVPSGPAIYVAGLITLLVFAAIEFISLVASRESKNKEMK